jgi:FtsP/CotA-like multicopper oxidase with cupredoxin domain
MMQGEEQVFGGMSGAIIVDGLNKLLPAGLRHITEHTLDLKDFQVNEQGEIISSGIDSNAPTTRTVNGQVDPVLRMRPGETQLWHIANIGADIFYDLHLDGSVFHVIAEDGHPVNTVWSANDLIMPPGKRYDVLVQAEAAGVSQLRTLDYSTGPNGDDYPDDVLATILTQGTPERPVRLPRHIEAFHDLRRDKIAAFHTLVFSENPDTDQFFINGQQFDANRVDVVARLGTTQEWTIVNTTDEQHPFHLHTNPFQVVSINGQPYQAHSYQDTVVLPVHGEVQILIRFSDFTGTTFFHCHIMHHEENGMMGVLQIV